MSINALFKRLAKVTINYSSVFTELRKAMLHNFKTFAVGFFVQNMVDFTF